MPDDRPAALITGAARRIGRAIALDLAKAGHPVAIHCHGSVDEADELAGGIRRSGGRAEVVQADLTDVAACARLIADAGERIGPLRMLINNASLFEADSHDKPDWDKWDAHFAIHVKAPVALSAGFAERMPADTDGLIVNIVDQRVWRLNPRFFSYTLSKSALWTATQTLAQGLAPRIRVNAIGPGPTMPNDRQSAADFSRQAESVLLGHGPSLEEFGRTIRYLWDTKSITGQMIAIDGGQHLEWRTADVTGVE